MSDQQTFRYPCGPTTMVVVGLDSFNQTIASAMYSCGYDECRYKRENGASKTSNRNSFIKIIVALLVVASLVSAEVAEVTEVSEIAARIDDDKTNGNVYNLTSEVQVNDDLLLKFADANASAVIDTFSGKYFEFLPADHIDLQENATSLAKRCTPTGPQISVVKEWQAAQSGHWWSPWYPVSCCYYCEKGPSTCSAELGYGYTYTWSVSGGVSFAAIAATTSFSLSKAEEYTTSFSCTWEGSKGPAQIWYQQRVYWVDMQSRDRIVSPGCSVVMPWSQYYRSDVPIKNSRNLGCSAGWEHIDCDAGNGQRCAR